jgi:hypothetical protein
VLVQLPVLAQDLSHDALINPDPAMSAVPAIDQQLVGDAAPKPADAQ